MGIAVAGGGDIGVGVKTGRTAVGVRAVLAPPWRRHHRQYQHGEANEKRGKAHGESPGHHSPKCQCETFAK